MNASEFVRCWRREKDNLLRAFTDPTGRSSQTAQAIAELGLTEAQTASLRTAIDGLLVDTLYTLLLGLDGEAAIGGVQHTYKLVDEDGQVISACGEIEAEAFEQFHGTPDSPRLP